MSVFSRFKSIILGADIDLINAYSGKIPSSIRIKRNGNGEYTTIQIVEINHKAIDDKTLLITQVKKRGDQTRAVNDLMMTYLDIPESLSYFFEKQLQFEGDQNKSLTLVKA